MAGVDESFGEKFSALLQPIRDLAQNWNIDVASELEDYMDELEDIKISFDGGETELNFAEAAMLIQGSTCVYSRKVEFLYSLVFQTLDLIADRKRSKHRLEDSFGPEDDPREEPEEDELLLLDDLPEAKNITLVELEGPPSAEESMAHLLAPAPLALSMNAEEKPGETSFKMLNCSINASGALLLDGQDALGLGGASGGDAINPTGTVGGALPSPIGGRVSFADDDDGGGDFDFDIEGDDDDAPMDRSLLDAPLEGGAPTGAPASPIAQDVPDPWERLDPHAEFPELDRPFRRGKTARAPKDAPPTELDAPPKAQAFLSALGAPSASALSGSYFKSQFGEALAVESKRRSARSRAAAKEAKLVAAPAELNTDADEDQVTEQADFDAGDFDAGLLADDDDEVEDIAPIVMEDFGEEEHDARLSSVVKSFEELCREHMDQHMLEAEKLSNDAGMAHRVHEWQMKLEPKLQEEEERKPFDIDEYGDDMLKRLDEARGDAEENTEKPFESIMCKPDDTRFDICRMFLATLQLANNGNVHIHAEESGPTTALRLKFLSRDMHAARVHNFTAPSAAEETEPAPAPAPAAKSKAKGKAKGKGKGKGKGKAAAKPKAAAAPKGKGKTKAKGKALGTNNRAGEAAGAGVKRKTRSTRAGGPD